LIIATTGAHIRPLTETLRFNGMNILRD